MTTTDTITAPAAAPVSQTIARREAVRFVALQAVLGLAAAAIAMSENVNVLHIDEATPLGQAATYGMAFTPLIAALAARLSNPRGRRGLRGLGFARVGWRPLLLAWITGLAPVLAAYVVVWLTGAGGFSGNAGSAALAGTVLVLAYLPLALAEDLGWRGLLVTRLAQVARPRTVHLVSGVLWSLSHVWLIVFLGGTPEGVSPVYAAAMFTVGTTALGYILSAMQLRWGLWPGVLAHATVNAVMYHFAEPSTVVTGPATNWIATETGLAYAVSMVVAALLFHRWFGSRADVRLTTHGVDASRAA
ncbi:MAG: CPBP family intramembrane metalloprotease [Propionibacteriaceae bacterium]|nr:CPBP family intramembrane metalloprotease [Propionibacteriaceae bacterium]